ncbi:MAG: hypothetical protein DHS20C14_18410 [Phycisphaeraceae bacterium]|nr:MAG: hypothetical protein DHS20C14_18410 [Phycisphaeraceae bacterium]
MHLKLRDMKRKDPGGWRKPGEPRCSRCFYDLGGIQAGACPECGAAWDCAWYEGKWPAGCGARTVLAVLSVQCSAIGVFFPGVMLAGLLFTVGRFLRSMGVITDDALFYGVMLGGGVLVVLTSAVCLVLSWRWYGLIRYGPASCAQRGVWIMLALLAAVLIAIAAFEIASRATNEAQAGPTSTLPPATSLIA